MYSTMSNTGKCQDGKLWNLLLRHPSLILAKLIQKLISRGFTHTYYTFSGGGGEARFQSDIIQTLSFVTVSQ